MKKIKIILVVLFVAFVAVKVVGKYYSSQALDRLLATEDSRQDLWKSALNVFKRHPLIGGGMSAASIESLLGAGNYSHNVYLDILCNSGLAGMIIFVLYLYNSILKTDKSNRAFIYSIFVAFMLPMFFINGFNTATFYTPLILMSLMSNYCKKEEYSYLDFL